MCVGTSPLAREQMGFDGLVVSDYGAVGNLHTVQRVAQSPAHAGLAALRAGMDVELHVPQGFGSDLRDGLAAGLAHVALLDRAVHQILTAKVPHGAVRAPLRSGRRRAEERIGRCAIARHAVLDETLLGLESTARPHEHPELRQVRVTFYIKSSER